MKILRTIIVFLLIMGSYSCNKLWEEHYLSPEASINESLWDVIQANPDYSEFVGYVSELGLDSIFESGGSYTLFIPNNEAFAAFNTDTGDMNIIIRYHVLDYVFNTINVTKSKLIQTSTGKFAPLELIDGNYEFGSMDIVYTSPLYRDGRFYETDGVAYPQPNLYEYIALNSLILRRYIDDYDSILLDLEKSKQLSFDEFGNIIYDSVYTIVNYFDSIYFPVNREDRNKTATFILFSDEEYTAALDQMAANMGGEITTGDDIPLIWREEVLIPELVNIGLFPNSLRYEDISQGRLKNVQGDTVEVDFLNVDPDSRLLCSNGVVFNYVDFQVPEYLYKGEVRIEGEHMVDSVGSGIYFWKDEYKVSGSTAAIAAKPLKNVSAGAENDSLVTLTFPTQPFTGEFVFEFYFKNMFPQKYLFQWGANYRPSGIYQVWVNDVLVREFDTFKLRQTVFGVNGDYYFANNGNNRFDAIVDHLTEYGDIKITLKYVGAGGTSSITPLNGFNIDFISLIPTE